MSLLFAVLSSKHLTAQNTTDSIDIFIKQKMVQSNIPGLQWQLYGMEKLINFKITVLQAWNIR